MTRGFLSTLGAFVAAVFGSLCCIGPFVAALLGITGAGVTQWFEPYRPWLIGATAALIAAGGYALYRQGSEKCAVEGVSCGVSKGQRWQKAVLWLATVVALLLLLFPYYIPLIT